MQLPIERLDSRTSQSIHAGLLFPTLSSIVVALVYNGLQARPTSRVQVFIQLAPEWQITCKDDGAGFTGLANESFQRFQACSLDYLGYLGTLDVQCGRSRHIQRADDILFSGLVEERMRGYTEVGSCVSIRDVYRNLPVRRQVLTTVHGIRSALDKCKRALAVLSLAHPAIHFVLRVGCVEQTGDRTLLDVPKTSLLKRYEALFGLPVSLPDTALPISVSTHRRGARLAISGFVVMHLLPSRAHQHILFNGRLEADEGNSLSSLPVTSPWSVLQDVVLQVMEESGILDDRLSMGRRAGGRASGVTPTSGRHCGFFLDVHLFDGDHTDLDQWKGTVQQALRPILSQPKGLGGLGKRVSKTSESLAQEDESPTKKQRGAKAVDKEDHQSIDWATSAVSHRRFTLDRSGLRREPSADNDDDEDSSDGWLQDILRSWKAMPSNEHTHECCIPTVRTNASPHKRSSPGHSEERRVQVLERSGLSSSRLIGQVDAKYIAILYHTSVLVFVDQHAAHERIRLESMLSAYLQDCLSNQCSQPLAAALQSAPLVLSDSLAGMFDDEGVRRGLSFWGFHLHAPQHLRPSEPAAVYLQSVPTVLREKLRSREAIEALFTDVAVGLQDDGTRHRLLTLPSSDRSHWAVSLRHLPLPILDLFHSVACRGAIMFNDPLTSAQCDTLISQLSRTTFPFQCAHGRPSMVPICTLAAPLETSSPASSLPIDWQALE